MEAESEYVLIDSSPILLVPDNLYMASAADGILLVVDSSSTRPRDLLRTKEVERTGSPIVGVVLNRALSDPHYYKQYMTYYKASQGHDKGQRGEHVAEQLKSKIDDRTARVHVIGLLRGSLSRSNSLRSVSRCKKWDIDLSVSPQLNRGQSYPVDAH
jgi:hypothetical protein